MQQPENAINPTLIPKVPPLGLWMTLALVIGTMIGSGIFLLPQSLVPLGINGLVGWVVSGIGAMAIAGSLALITRRGDGGIQAYIERSFGPTVAFLVTWSLWVSNWAAAAALGIATAKALAWLFPVVGGGAPFIAVALGAVALVTVINALGATTSGEAQIVTTIIKIVPLVAVVVLFASPVTGYVAQPLAPVPLSLAGIGTAVALTLYALTGFENATAPVDKIRNPRRTIPLAMVAGTALVALLYIAASYAILRLLPGSTIIASNAPFAEVMNLRLGKGFAIVTALAIAIAAFGALNGIILATGELAFSMALRGDFPALFSRTRGEQRTPVNAQLLGSLVAALLILANASKSTIGLFEFALLLSTAAVLILYVAGAIAAWRENPRIGPRSMVILALGFIAFAFWGAGLEANLWGLVLLALGFAVRSAVRRFGSTRVLAGPQAAPPE